uniref:Uncharacterized protein n=1 Tax=Megaselia scalaris TaxID=36166 RepID=T1GHI2_MEGSC
MWCVSTWNTWALEYMALVLPHWYTPMMRVVSAKILGDIEQRMPMHETTLVRSDNEYYVGFQELSHDGFDDFVCYVEQTDSSVVFAVTLIFFLGDRADDAVIPLFRHLIVEA